MMKKLKKKILRKKKKDKKFTEDFLFVLEKIYKINYYYLF